MTFFFCILKFVLKVHLLPFKGPVFRIEPYSLAEMKYYIYNYVFISSCSPVTTEVLCFLTLEWAFGIHRGSRSSSKGVLHVAPPCFYSSPEQTKTKQGLQRGPFTILAPTIREREVRCAQLGARCKDCLVPLNPTHWTFKSKCHTWRSVSIHMKISIKCSPDAFNWLQFPSDSCLQLYLSVTAAIETYKHGTRIIRELRLCSETLHKSEHFLFYCISYHCTWNLFVFWTAGWKQTSSTRMTCRLFFSESWIHNENILHSLAHFAVASALQPCICCYHFIFFVNVPLKDYIILCAPFSSLATFLSVQPFLPRDKWLIHRCITLPPPDPQYHRRLWSQHTFQWRVQSVMILDDIRHVPVIRSWRWHKLHRCNDCSFQYHMSLSPNFH